MSPEDPRRRRVPVIVGPTAAGKTRAALDLAAADPRIEIVSADSRQIYIGMDIGTAKPSTAELAAVPHHMIDVATPDQLYSAGVYAERASSVIAGIIGRGGIPLVVGGSGFYVKALFEGLGAPPVDQAILAGLERRAAAEGGEALHRELAAIDPAAAAAHSPHNLVKTLRALACWYQTGTPYSRFLAGDESEGASPWEPSYLGIAPERKLLYDRIDRRVLEMIEQGLVGEVERLLASGIPEEAPGLKTVGYVEMIAWLRGEVSWDRAVEQMQQSSRRYAKRQMTWFRRVPDVTWIDAPDPAAVRAWYERAIPTPDS